MLITNSTFPWKYYFDFRILEVQEVNDDKQTLTLSMYMQVRWFEPRLEINESSLEWNETKFGPPDEVNTSPKMLNYLLLPDVEIFGLQKFATKKILTHLSGMKIGKEKKITYGLRVDVTISCLMNFHDYPLDSHDCPFDVGSYNYYEDTVNCESTYNYDPTYQRSLQHAIYIEELPRHNKTNDMEDENESTDFAKCGFNVVLRRTRIQMLFQVYLTFALFVIVSWVSFVIKPDVVPGRMGLLITVFLVLINIFNGVKSKAPVSARVNAVDEYLLLCIGLVFLALVEYTLVLCGNRDDTRQHATSKVLNVREKNMETSPSFETEHTSTSLAIRAEGKKPGCMRSKADSFSLVIFPILFVCLNVAYWIFQHGIFNMS